MVKWIREWLVLSTLAILGLGMVFMFWAIGPLLPMRFPSDVVLSLDFEGVLTMALFFVVVVGFGKLMCCK